MKICMNGFFKKKSSSIYYETAFKFINTLKLTT